MDGPGRHPKKGTLEQTLKGCVALWGKRIPTEKGNCGTSPGQLGGKEQGQCARKGENNGENGRRWGGRSTRKPDGIMFCRCLLSRYHWRVWGEIVTWSDFHFYGNYAMVNWKLTIAARADAKGAQEVTITMRDDFNQDNSSGVGER